MPELAEVEYYRNQWRCGLNEKICAIALHAAVRIFRGSDMNLLQRTLPGTILTGSETHGKQMLFQFSNHLWLGLHLGMTGKLHIEKPDYKPDKHDHLVLYQKGRALVLTDPRQFGRVRFHQGIHAPTWWSSLPIQLTSPRFTATMMRNFLQRHSRLPIKAALLLQTGFPGIGNWMADEILWRGRVHPQTAVRQLHDTEIKNLWRELRFVCREAVRKIAVDLSDPPHGWLFHERWRRGGKCPRDGATLVRETIGGRTTAWCRKCQKRR
jgi:formamidopyrimidine-DNA glycosylase